MIHGVFYLFTLVFALSVNVNVLRTKDLFNIYNSVAYITVQHNFTGMQSVDKRR